MSTLWLISTMTSIQLSTVQWSSVHNKIFNFCHCKISTGSSDSMIPLGILPSTSTTSELWKPGGKTSLMAHQIAMKVARWLCAFHLNQPSTVTVVETLSVDICYCGFVISLNRGHEHSETSNIISKHHTVMQNKMIAQKQATRYGQ